MGGGMDADAEEPEEFEPTRNTICACMFSDGKYHRVRCDGITAQGTWRVFYLDYGNHDVVDQKNLRALPDDIRRLPGLARSCLLAGIKKPAPTSEYAPIAAEVFNEYVFGADLVAKVEHVDRSGKLMLTVMERDSDVSINQQMVHEGWVRLMERPERALAKLVNSWKEDENYAKAEHLNIWEYGDVSDDDEDLPERWDGGRVPR